MRIAHIIGSSLALTSMFASSSAFAQNCPPGSWFCADGQVGAAAQTQPAPAPAAPAASGALEPLPQAPAPSTTVVVNNAPAPAAPAPVVVAKAPPPVVYVQAPKLFPDREWGLNVHMQGAMIAKREDVNSSGMVGIGGALRYRPSRSFALEGSIDLYGGTDYAGRSRGEASFSAGGYLFLSPQSRTQPYVTGGIGWSTAAVGSSRYEYSTSYSYGPNSGYYSEAQTTYRYFGGYLGLGLEHRLNRSLALNADLRGFVRSRTDKGAEPEFVSIDGRTTNTSGGLLITLGGTLYL
jgi:hypothetical protein